VNVPTSNPILYGLHDQGGADYMLQHGYRGVALVHVLVGEEPVQLDYRQYTKAGITVLLRVGWGYADGAGALPRPDHISKFERAAATTLNAAKGVTASCYGNEPNNPSEHPGWNAETGQPGLDYFKITPAYYLASYNRVWNKTLTTTMVAPAPLDPCFGPGSNNRTWWIDVLKGIKGADALFLHAKTQTNDPTEVTSNAKFADAPLQWQHLGCRQVGTALEVVPARFKNRPVYITELNPQRTAPDRLGWLYDNAAWVREAKSYLKQWNVGAGHQKINGAVFYRWADDDWRLSDKPAILNAIFEGDK
jgi:hypothetical protein